MVPEAWSELVLLFLQDYFMSGPEFFHITSVGFNVLSLLLVILREINGLMGFQPAPTIIKFSTGYLKAKVYKIKIEQMFDGFKNAYY